MFDLLTTTIITREGINGAGEVVAFKKVLLSLKTIQEDQVQKFSRSCLLVGRQTKKVNIICIYSSTALKYKVLVLY